MTDNTKKLSSKKRESFKSSHDRESRDLKDLIMETPSIEEKMLDGLTDKLSAEHVLSPEQCEQVRESLINIAVALDSLNQLQTVLLDRVRSLNTRVQALEEEGFDLN